MSASRSPNPYQLALRHSESLIAAQPGRNTAATSRTLVRGLTSALIGFVFAFAPPLGVARQVHFDSVRLAPQGVDIFLALQAEDRIAEAEIVPVGMAAPHRVEAGAAADKDKEERRWPHAAANRRVGPLFLPVRPS